MKFLLIHASIRQLVVGVLAVLVVAFLMILLLPADLPTLKGAKVQDLPWTLPGATSIESDAAVSVISQRHLWGAPAAVPGQSVLVPPPVEKPLTPPDWRIRGVYAVGNEYAALLLVPGQPVKVLAVGDALPGGAKIVAISPYQLTIQLGRQRLHLSTYEE